MSSSLFKYLKLCARIEIMNGHLPNSPRTASLTEYLPVHKMYLHSLIFNFSNAGESHTFLKLVLDFFHQGGCPYVASVC